MLKYGVHVRVHVFYMHIVMLCINIPAYLHNVYDFFIVNLQYMYMYKYKQIVNDILHPHKFSAGTVHVV